MEKLKEVNYIIGTKDDSVKGGIRPLLKGSNLEDVKDGIDLLKARGLEPYVLKIEISELSLDC